MSPSFRLDDKVALVTGASRGLGAGIADGLREAGATVVGTSRDPGSAAQVAERLGTPPVVMDVADVSSVREGVDRVASELGRLDILVNNAGVNVPQGLFEVDEASWDAVVDTNLKGTFFASQAAARHMVSGADGGRIVNITSQAGVVGIEERSAYGASKGGAITLTKVLALELAQHGITVNSVAPTFVATELTRATLENPQWRERILSRIPLGRVGEVEDVVAAAVYLASPAARMVTGHTLLVDGGWTAW
ncbi:MAG: 2-deoxy-D-gluconate 3-dehydrogenase [Actinobacteria bacterium]|nr:glucose 1-dehydrogenase [Actinomycetota bacterium]PLS84263.1 MAG: 2-deoxy-D-gluconate 3-dehydrogenase [Actinomycetota bacterium]